MEKRILFIAHDALAYGANQSLINAVSSLKSKGVYVTVVFPERGIICEIFEEREWEYHIVYFKNELCPKVDGPVVYIKNILRRCFKVITNSLALKKLSEIVELKKINIIHSNSSVVSIGKKLARVKNIHHVIHLREYIHPNHGLYVFDGLKKYKNKIRKSKNIICISEGICKAFNLEGNSLTLRDAIRKEPKYSSPVSKEKYFLFCGSVSKNKGIEEAIEAFYKFSLNYSDYKLLVVGGGNENYKSYLLRQVKEMNMVDRICFLGFRSDIDDLMAKSRALLMCSRNEGLGRVTIEAMFNFCVVFGFNDSGTSEVISHGETGFLYNSIDELIDYMNGIVNNENSFNIVRDNAYRYAKSEFSERVFGDKLIQYYDSLN